MRHRPTTFMKKPNPNFDHNMSKNRPAISAQNLQNWLCPEKSGKLQSYQLWYLGHNLSHKTQNGVIQKKKICNYTQ